MIFNSEPDKYLSEHQELIGSFCILLNGFLRCSDSRNCWLKTDEFLCSFVYNYIYADVPNITELTFDRQSRTVTCTYTSGPATNVTWTKDGAVIILNGTFQQMQIIADATKGIYQNILTIAQSLPEHIVYGLYNCIVENPIGSSNRTNRYSGKISSHLRVSRSFM